MVRYSQFYSLLQSTVHGSVATPTSCEVHVVNLEIRPNTKNLRSFITVKAHCSVTHIISEALLR